MSYSKVSRNEVVLLVLGFLKDEKDAFPATLQSFLKETVDSVSAVKSKDRNVKNLTKILEEYVDLKREKLERENLANSFRTDPVTALNVTQTMDSIVALLEDYKAARAALILPDGNLVSGMSLERQRVASHQHDASLEELVDIREHAQKVEPEQPLEAPVSRQVSLSSNDNSPGRSSKRRKETPTHWIARAHAQTSHGHSHRSSVAAGATGHADRQRGQQGAWGMHGSSKDVPEPRTKYTEISESVLSDPQISQLLMDTNMDELFTMLEGDNFESLVEPLTKHINTFIGSGRMDDDENSDSQIQNGSGERVAEGGAERVVEDPQSQKWTGTDCPNQGRTNTQTPAAQCSARSLALASSEGHTSGGCGGAVSKQCINSPAEKVGGTAGNIPVFPQGIDIDKFLQTLHSKPVPSDPLGG